MATFKIEAQVNCVRADDSVPMIVRIRHQDEERVIQMPHIVMISQVNSDGEVVDEGVKSMMSGVYGEIRDIINELGFRVNAYSPSALREYVKQKLEMQDGGNLNFFDFARTFIAAVKQPSTARNYTAAVLNLAKYVVKPEGFSLLDITANFLNKYMNWMAAEGGQNGTPLGERGRSLYLGCIRAIFNEAQKTYNDYDKGIIPIQNRPFERFKIPKARPLKTSDVKALPLKKIKKIRDYKPKYKLDALAQDCFMLSFYLCGMNSVDLYWCEELKDGVLKYYRTKTKNRRADRAELRIRVEPEVKHLFEKYRGCRRVFNFSEMYANPSNFNSALNYGLKRVGRACGVSDLEYYYARHSWASLASNECNLPIDVVGMCLGHSGAQIVTNIYIKRSWNKIYKANRRVLNLLAGNAGKKKPNAAAKNDKGGWASRSKKLAATP